MAGFDDVHMHLLSGARQLDDIDLSAARNPREIAVAIRACAAARPDEGWVVGRGWLYAAFPDGLPTRSRLDPLVPDRPALITAYDGHSAWANSRALEAAGVRHDTPDPPNGTILRDPASGEPSGALLEEAVLLVENRLPLPSREQDLAALRRAIAAVQLTGITSVQEAWSSTEDVPVWRDLVGRGELTLRARLALPMKPEVDLPTWREQLLAFTAEVSGLAAGRWLWGGILHGEPSPNQATAWADQIGPQRAALAWAAGTISRAGGRLAFGSDWPVVPFNPFLGLQVAVNRQTPRSTATRRLDPGRSGLAPLGAGCVHARFGLRRTSGTLERDDPCRAAGRPGDP